MTDEITTLSHATTREAAEIILKEGFRDATNFEGQTGVWFSIPAVNSLDRADGSIADTLVEVDVPANVAEEAKDNPPPVPSYVRAMFANSEDAFQAYCLSADAVNQYMPFRMRPINAEPPEDS